MTGTPYVASYLLVAVLGLASAAWNSRLRVPAPAATAEVDGTTSTVPARSYAELWRQPVLLLGVTAAVVAALTMIALMTAGPILGLSAGRTRARPRWPSSCTSWACSRQVSWCRG